MGWFRHQSGLQDMAEEHRACANSQLANFERTFFTISSSLASPDDDDDVIDDPTIQTRV